MFSRKLVEIYIDETVGFKENCIFHSIQEKHLMRRRASFYLKLSLPLVRKGYKYIFKQSAQEETIYRKLLDQRIFWFLMQRLKEFGISSNIQFSSFVNSLEKLEIPRNGHGRLNYVKNLLSKELGDEIFGIDPAIKKEITVDVHLNDILPTIEYDKNQITESEGKSKTYEDKNIPVRVKVFPLSRQCLDVSKNTKDLIILINLALSKSNREETDTISKLQTKVRFLSYFLVLYQRICVF